jgi:stearoyl-CoA 9-desaturase NADPH oxidoreductase
MRPETTIWSSPWLYPLNDVVAIDDLLAQLHPTWSLRRIKARVDEILVETPDTKTFVLRPNRHWPGFRAGQHVGVEIEIAGVRHVRRYSLSSAPTREPRVTITVKRQPGGKVSNWLHDHVRIGDALVLEPPAGEFVLPSPLPAGLLMLSAGSGITPLMAMLRTVLHATVPIDITFIHVARRPDDAIFARELADFSASDPRLTRHRHFTAEHGRFTPATLARLAPDYHERSTLLCGPPSFMATLQEHFRAEGLAARLDFESFGAVLGDTAATATTEIRCARSERLFTSDGTTPLLVAAEQAGLRPRYGCRMGICHSCSCVKRDGTVENLRTGEISSEPGERIQLCISRARSDLTLEL